jgi:hypothetical protein
LVADSKETRVCSYLSLALLVGVAAFALFGWWWADSAGALAMLPVILWQGRETLAEAGESHHEEPDSTWSATPREAGVTSSDWSSRHRPARTMLDDMGHKEGSGDGGDDAALDGRLRRTCLRTR